MKDLYNKTIPEIKKFEDLLVELTNENKKTQEIVARFDIVMTEKASK